MSGQIGEDNEARHLIRKFDIKQRVFYGNTSMEAEVSLLMANQALAAPGKIMYDPFAGTGSMLYVRPFLPPYSPSTFFLPRSMQCYAFLS